MKKILTAWLQRHPFSSSPAEKENVHPPLFLPVISQSWNRHPLSFSNASLRATQCTLIPTSLMETRYLGGGEGTNPPLVDKIEKRITRRWSQASGEKDRRWRAPPFTGRASPLWFSHYRRGGLSLSSPPTSNSKSASFHIASLISLRPISWWARDHARLPSFP